MSDEPPQQTQKGHQKSAANEQRIKLKNILKEKREERTALPNLHTTPSTYAEALKNPVENSPQVINPTTPTPQASSSNITDTFQQLKDPECIEMFRMLKKFIAISKSGKSTSDRFTEIMTLLQIDPINV
ncbi:hypothetical protein NPIL_569461 [Nephila pilipes]|uniref:Uncharacterized protein n=1 Tax=Nephila pilipes TaxID=299642 RepID=A0A8X6QQJ6_NEPPI|nr:hypothetical protein NPIL_569461 [Nephila pilipes]